MREICIFVICYTSSAIHSSFLVEAIGEENLDGKALKKILQLVHVMSDAFEGCSSSIHMRDSGLHHNKFST